MSGKQRALLVGIDDYEHATRLRFARADVEALAAHLEHVCGFSPQDVVTMTERSSGRTRPIHNQILGELERMAKRTEPQDTFLFYFAGHGIARGGQTYLLGLNADPTSARTLRATAVALTDVQEVLAGMSAGQQVILVDCCRCDPEQARGADPGLMTDEISKPFRDIVAMPASSHLRSQQPRRAVLLACSEGQRSWEWDEHGHSAFNWYVRQCLGSKGADENGEIVMTRVAEHLEVCFREWTSLFPDRPQHPQLLNLSGRVVLGRVPQSAVDTSAIVDQRGTISIRSESPGLVRLDASRTWQLAKGQVLRIPVESGPHSVIFEGMDPDLRNIDVRPGETIELTLGTPIELVDPTGHSDSVRCLAASVSGDRLVSADQYTVRIWSVPDGRELRRIATPGQSFERAAVSGDGRVVVSAQIYQEGLITTWLAETGRLLAGFRRTEENSHVNSVGIDHAATFVVSSHGDEVTAIWDLRSSLQQPLAEFKNTIHRVSGGGNRLAWGEPTGKIVIWDTTSRAICTDFQCDSVPLRWLVLSNGGSYLLAGSDKSLELWDVKNAQRVAAFATAHYINLAVSEDGHWAAAADEDHATVFEIKGPNAAPANRGGRHVSCVAVGNGWWASGDHQGGVTAHDLKWSSSELFRLGCGSAPIRSLAISGNRILLQGPNVIWDLGRGSESIKRMMPCAALSASLLADRAVSVNESGTLRVFRPSDALEVSRLSGHTRSVTSVALSADGLTALSGDPGGEVRLWDLRDGSTAVLTQGKYGVSWVALNPEGDYAVVAWRKGGAQLYRRSKDGIMEQLRAGQFHRDYGLGCVLHGGRYLITGNRDGFFKWDLTTWEPGYASQRLGVDEDAVIDIISPSQDGSCLISGGMDSMVRIWNLETGSVALRVPAHVGHITGVGFGPTAQWFAAAGAGGVRIWSREGDEIAHAIFTPAGGWLIHTPDHYYCASGDLDPLVYFRKGFQFLDSPEIKARFRQPDIIDRRLHDLVRESSSFAP